MNGAMSAFGTKWTYRLATHMSAIGGKADIAIASQISAMTPLRAGRDAELSNPRVAFAYRGHNSANAT